MHGDLEHCYSCLKNHWKLLIVTEMTLLEAVIIENKTPFYFLPCRRVFQESSQTTAPKMGEKYKECPQNRTCFT